MKGDKIKVIIIYILIVIIIALIGLLAYIVLTSNNKDDKLSKEPVTEKEQIAAECKFDVSIDDYNAIINDVANSQLCSGDNEINVIGVMVGGNEQNIRVNFYNGDGEGNGAVYLNEQKVVDGASLSVHNGLGIFDDKLFIFTDRLNDLNVYAYDGNGTQVYNLETVLANAQITDPALNELAQTNTNISTIVYPGNIDGSTMHFSSNEFTFNTTSGLQCTAGAYSGSSYKVTFSGTTFNAPQFISTNVCP